MISGVSCAPNAAGRRFVPPIEQGPSIDCLTGLGIRWLLTLLSAAREWAMKGFSMRWRLVAVPGAVAIVLSLLGAAGVSAATTGGNLTYPAAHTQALPDDSATAAGVTSDQVGCPMDFPNPVGGGVRIDGTDPGLDLEVHSSAPGTNAWGVAANNNIGSTASMTTFAICAKGTYVYPHNTVTIKPGHSKTLKVSCPADTQVIGGGVAIVGGDHADEVRASEPADGSDADHAIGDAWFGAAGNGSAVKVKMTVTAICDGSSATYQIKFHAPVLLLTNHKNSAQVMCPSGTRVVGGGADITGSSTNMEIHDMYPIDGSDADSIPDNGFKATGYNDGDPGTRQLTTFVICKVV